MRELAGEGWQNILLNLDLSCFRAGEISRRGNVAICGAVLQVDLEAGGRFFPQPQGKAILAERELRGIQVGSLAPFFFVLFFDEAPALFVNQEFNQIEKGFSSLDAVI